MRFDILPCGLALGHTGSERLRIIRAVFPHWWELPACASQAEPSGLCHLLASGIVASCLLKVSNELFLGLSIFLVK